MNAPPSPSAFEDAARFPRLARSTLGIVAGNVAVRIAGGVRSNHSQTRVYHELGKRAGRAVLGITLLREANAGMNDDLRWPERDLLALPPMATTIAAQRYTLAAHRAVKRVAERSDVLFVRMPFQVPWALYGLDRPMVLHFGADVYEIVKASTDYKGIWRAASLGYARAGESAFRYLIRQPGVRVATNGERLLDKYGARDRGIAVVSSCLSEREMDAWKERPLPKVPRLLFVGYLRPEKGLDVLLDAFESLRAERPLKLTLAGGEDRATEAGRRIRERIEASLWRDDISIPGHVEYGEELFGLYRAHDVFVLPSLSEGTPRALIEARAFGCPVVSTRVGGIPTSVTDGHDGLLVPPGDAPSLASAIARILEDEELRKSLGREGSRRAHNTSLEAFVDQLAGQLELALEEGA